MSLLINNFLAELKVMAVSPVDAGDEESLMDNSLIGQWVIEVLIQRFF